MSLQSKISRPFAYKSVGNSIQDIAGRTVVFYSNAFDKMDDQNDIIRKGAYQKSIQSWGPNAASNRKIKHCLWHDETQMPGVITELAEDQYGLRVAVKMSDTQLGNDTLEYYKDGVYTEHSIRIGYVPGRIKEVKDASVEGGRYFDVTEVKLWHTSTVSFGSNEHTGVIGVKSIATEADRETAIVTINNRMNTLTKAIRNGKYSDEGFKTLSYELSECQDAYNALLQSAPGMKSTLTEQAPHTTPDPGKGTEAPDLTFLKSFSIR